jgi:hypothetical protein
VPDHRHVQPAAQAGRGGGRTSVDAARLAGPVGRSQVFLEHLAGWIAGQGGDEIDGRWALVAGKARFSESDDVDAMELVVRGAAGMLARARQMGLATRDDAFALCGVWMRLREERA